MEKLIQKIKIKDWEGIFEYSISLSDDELYSTREKLRSLDVDKDILGHIFSNFCIGK